MSQNRPRPRKPKRKEDESAREKPIRKPDPGQTKPKPKRKPARRKAASKGRVAKTKMTKKKGTMEEAKARPLGAVSPSEGAVRESAAFREAETEARATASHPERLRTLSEEASKKSLVVPKSPFAETWTHLLTMIRLIRGYTKGEYRSLSKQSLLLIIAGVIYFVSQIDFIPDWIPFAGLLDDSVVLGWVLKKVKDELDAYVAWERRKG